MSFRRVISRGRILLLFWIGFCSTGTLAQSLYHPCNVPAPFTRVNRSDNYPVVVYDAYRRKSYLMYKELLLSRIGPAGLANAVLPAPLPDLSEMSRRPLFLCSQYPVEVFVLNARLMTDFTISLTAAIRSESGHLAISGYSSTVAPAPAAASAPTAPAAKGFTPLATGNLLTTDAIIADLLNEETFDRPLTRIQDDASAVVAQAAQLRASYLSYIVNVARLSAAPVGSGVPSGNISAAAVQAEFKALDATANRPITTGLSFSEIVDRGNRLQQEIGRLNTQLESFPVVDLGGNLAASTNTLRDNIRGVLTEYNSLYLATSILDSYLDSPGGKQYINERRIAEIRTMLRNQYTSTTTVDDQTLARIVALLAGPNALGPGNPAALESRLAALRGSLGLAGPCAVGSACAERDWIDSMRRALRLTGLALPPYVTAPPPQLTDSPLSYPTPASPIPASNFDIILGDIRSRVYILERGIERMNREVALTFADINNAYETHYTAFQELPFDISGYGKNLNVYFTVSASERFHRFQIINETPQPQSACALANAADTSTAGGALTCLTFLGSQLPVAAATFSSAVPPYAAGSTSTVTLNAAAVAPEDAQTTTAASQPQAVAPSANSSGTPTSGTPTSSTVPPPDYHGFFEVHHFSEGELVTGAAYDSVVSYSYSWFTCPLNATYPNGNTSSANCASFQTSSAGTTSTTDYYLLTQTQQVPVAAVQGINLSLFGPKDTFVLYPKNIYYPDAFLGIAVYPLNHYYVGLSETVVRGFNLTGGMAVGSQAYLPANSSYQVNGVYTVNPSIGTSARFRKGFFVMVDFRTSLFKDIFNGSAFTNVLQIGNAGSATAQTTQP